MSSCCGGITTAKLHMRKCCGGIPYAEVHTRSCCGGFTTAEEEVRTYMGGIGGGCQLRTAQVGGSTDYFLFFLGSGVKSAE